MSTPRITCTRRLEFDAAHRVVEHESKCRNLHGHRYVVQATFEANKLDTLGRVVDFGIVREKLGGWIDEQWDHTTLLWEKDAELGKAISGVTKQKIYYLPYNPTAENIAQYLLTQICPKLFADEALRCTGILIYETPNCQANAFLPD